VIAAAKRKPRRIGSDLEGGFLILVAVIVQLPFVWLLMTAFKERTDILSPTPTLLFAPTWGNFLQAFVAGKFDVFLRNSLIVASCSVLLCMAVGLPAAYAFSRFRVFGGKHLFFYVLTTRMAPGIAIVLPLYMFFQTLGILGTVWAVTIAHATFNLALVIYLMRNFFDDVPKELDEAALLDGATEWHVFSKVVLPLARPGIAVAMVLAFLFSWNEFLFAMIIGGTEAQTLPAGFPGLVTPLGTYWGQLAAVSVVVSVPVLILVWSIQRHLARGLTLGAVR
jgi:multiple sugar transport system permease protein